LLPAKFGKLERSVVYRHRKTISGAGEGLAAMFAFESARNNTNMNQLAKITG
jgi:hypothetical protein